MSHIIVITVIVYHANCMDFDPLKHMTAKRLISPVLFIIFNKPASTREVFESIRQARPPRLYIAADGPRSEIKSDVDLCGQVRSVTDAVDWDCEVVPWYRKENLGCDKGVFAAVNWFFEKEPEGIILEDDCLPGERFFQFCQESLQRYRDDNRVMHICGSNPLGRWNNEDYSYYFSRHASVGGWASWRRAWRLYGFTKPQYQAIKNHGYFDEYFPSHEEKLRWFKIFNDLASEPDNQKHWVHRWDYSRFIQSGLSVIPGVTLVTTTDSQSDVSQDISHPPKGEGVLFHPPFVIRNMEADKRYFSTVVKRRKVTGNETISPSPLRESK